MLHSRKQKKEETKKAKDKIQKRATTTNKNQQGPPGKDNRTEVRGIKNQIKAMTPKRTKEEKTRKLGLFFFLLLLFGSCTEAPFYEKVYSFDNMEWLQEVKPEYNVEITDLEQEYDFTLSLRVTTDYPYNNLWVFMKTETPDGTTAREPFEIIISNPDGSWVGNKTGTIIETPLYFKKRKLPQKGLYKFTLEQGITQSKVNEVLDLGFRIEKAKEN